MMAQLVKNLATMWESAIRFLGQEDPLERGMVPHSSVLAGRISWTVKPDGLWSMGLQRIEHK